VNWLRTVAFMIVFYLGSLPIVLLTPITTLFGRKALIVHTHIWTRFHGWTTEHILGIHRRVEGELYADGPVIYAAKHQAMYETLELGRMLRTPAIVMKQELASIPIWGWADKNEKITVQFNSQVKTVKADKAGKWRVDLDAMAAGGPFQLIVKGKNIVN